MTNITIKLASLAVALAPSVSLAGGHSNVAAIEAMLAKDAMETALSCWARGMDLTIGGDAETALATWTECYAHPDYQFRVFFQGQTIEGVGAAGRAQTNVQTAGMFGYNGAYHYISNVEVELGDAGAATAKAIQTADHFLEDGTVETTYGVITVRFAQIENGRWLAVDETMDIQRMVGFQGLPAPAAMVRQ